MTDNYKLIGITASGEQKSVRCKFQANRQRQVTGISAEQVLRHALTADRLSNPRKITLINEVSGWNEFDGSQDIEIYTTVGKITNTELEEMLV